MKKMTESLQVLHNNLSGCPYKPWHSEYLQAAHTHTRSLKKEVTKKKTGTILPTMQYLYTSTVTQSLRDTWTKLQVVVLHMSRRETASIPQHCCTCVNQHSPLHVPSRVRCFHCKAKWDCSPTTCENSRNNRADTRQSVGQQAGTADEMREGWADHGMQKTSQTQVHEQNENQTRKNK